MRIFVESFGCTLNKGEGRWLARQLSQAGHTIISSEEHAEARVLVTCTVIDATERKMLKRMRRLSEDGRRLVVAGCMASAQAATIRDAVPEAEILPPTQMKGIREIFPPPTAEQYDCLKPHFTVDGIVPISQGCLASCTYCISTIARGPLRSYRPESVVSEVEAALARGRKEIRLTCLDAGQYGRDLGLNLADLIREACAVDGEFRVKVGMMSPTMLRPILNDLVDAYSEEKVFNFLHLPFQSGNDGILRRVRRGYTVGQFWDVVEAFRQQVRPLALATDVIVGLPGEGEAEFEDTLALVRELRPDILNVTRYSPRPGTPAASMKDNVPGWVVKGRSRELTRLRFEIGRARHRGLVGSTLHVMTTEEGKRGTTLARSEDYRPVVLQERLPLGEFLDVIIRRSKETYIVGETLESFRCEPRSRDTLSTA